MVFTDTFNWIDAATVEVTVTEDAPGYEGLYLWNYHVTNDAVSPGDGLEIFSISVGDPDDVGNLGTSQAGWSATVGFEGNPYAVGWQGGPSLDWVQIGESADFWFTASVAAVASTSGFVASPGYFNGAEGPAVAPAPRPANNPPTFVAVSSALRLITPDQPFYFHDLADDTDDDVLTYSATNLPAGLSIDATSGIITGTPTNLPAAGETVTFTVSVSDGRGGTAQENFTFTVTPPFATWVINTIDDDRNNLSAASSDKNLADGAPLDWNNKVSLRAAIEQANYNRQFGQQWPTAPIYVTFDAALDGQETVLGRSLDTIQANIVFIGRGRTQTFVAGNPAGGGYNTQGIFRFATGSTSAVTGMTLETGLNDGAPGGAVAIATGSSVFLDSARIRNCNAKSGGAIYSDGYAATINSTIVNNHAIDDQAPASGGGIHVMSGYFVSQLSEFYTNTGVVKGGGIAINGTGKAFIYSTDINGNQCALFGGIYLSGGQRLVVQSSMIVGNSTTNAGGDGGGVSLEGRTSIRGTYFDGNTAAGKGGAIFFQSGSLTLNGCTFGNNNTAANGPKLAAANGLKLSAASGNNTNFDPTTDIYFYQN